MTKHAPPDMPPTRYNCLDLWIVAALAATLALAVIARLTT